MNQIGDSDGKSKTSSSVDSEHYPDVSEQKEQAEESKEGQGAFSFSEIQQRAHDLWVQAGHPEGTEQENWYEAERQILEARRDRTDAKTMAAQAGAIQR